MQSKKKSDHNTLHVFKKTGLIVFSLKFQNKGVLYRKSKTLNSVAFV